MNYTEAILSADEVHRKENVTSPEGLMAWLSELRSDFNLHMYFALVCDSVCTETWEESKARSDETRLNMRYQNGGVR